MTQSKPQQDHYVRRLRKQSSKSIKGHKSPSKMEMSRSRSTRGTRQPQSSPCQNYNLDAFGSIPPQIISKPNNGSTITYQNLQEFPNAIIDLKS